MLFIFSQFYYFLSKHVWHEYADIPSATIIDKIGYVDYKMARISYHSIYIGLDWKTGLRILFIMHL